MNFEPILYGPLFIRDAQDINLVAASADPVNLTVSVGGSSWTIPVTPVLTNNRYLAALRMREILSSVVGIPGLANAGELEVPMVTLSAGDATMSVRAVYGAASGKTPTQLAGHWLSWRDQVSTTHAWGRERLTFLAGLDLLGWQSGTYSVKAKIFLSSGNPVTVTLTSGTLQSGCRYVTVDASYATIAAAVSSSVRSKIRAWDVSYSFSGTDSQSAAATINGYPLRLIIARDEVRVKEFVFCNSFGVEDRVYSSGRSNPKLDGSSVAFLSGATEYELRNDSTEGREVYSGRLGSARESALWLDFLKAHDRYILASGGLARIIVDSQETDLQDNALGSVKFTYHLGALDNGRYFNDQEGLGDYDPTQRHGALYIGDEPPSEELPSEDLFFLKTRLDEFPVADLSEEYLFLVQDPLTLEWCNAPLSDIKEWLQQVITHEDVHVWSGPWEDYSAGVAGYALAASLGKDLCDRIEALEEAPAYQLPIATATRLGGIKVGSGLAITQDGVLSAVDVCYFEQDPDYSGEAHLKSAYAGLRIPGLRFGAGRETFDLEVRNVAAEGETPVYALYTPLPLVTNGIKIGGGDPILTWDSVNEAWHLSGNFYADGFVSSGGVSDTGGSAGIDPAAMWAYLKNTSSDHTYDTDLIAAAHIPDVASVYGYVKDAELDAVTALIPAQASPTNQLADKAFVNSSIATATATYRGNYNEYSDLGLQPSATHAQIATALASEISGADANDYCFVEIPTSTSDPTQIERTERYKYNGTGWEYEYTLNNSGFTAVQWAAINSNITSGKVSTYDTIAGYFSGGKILSTALPAMYIGKTAVQFTSATQDLTGIGNVTLDNAKYLRAYNSAGDTLYNLAGMNASNHGYLGAANSPRTNIRGKTLYFQSGDSGDTLALYINASQAATFYGTVTLLNNKSIQWKNKPAEGASEINIGLLNLSSSNVLTLGSGLISTGNNARAYNTYLYGGTIYFYTGDTTTGATRKWYISSAGDFIPNGEYRIGSSSHYVKEAYAKKVYLAANTYIEVDSNGYVHLVTPSGKGFYCDGFVSGNGLSSGGGASGIDALAMWKLLTNDQTLSSYDDSTKIAGAHIPDMATTYSYVKTADIADMATKTWVAAQDYSTVANTVSNVAVGGSGHTDKLAITKNGSTSYLTVPYATNVARFKRYEGTAEAGGYDLNTLLSNGGITSQNNSVYYWANAPTNMSYGGALQVNPSPYNTLAMQFAWDVDHTNVKTGHLWWRDSIYKNSTHTWGEWHLIYDDTTLTKSVITGLLDTGDGTYVDLTGEQTISGTKTFSAAPILNNGIFIMSKDSGGVTRSLLELTSGDRFVLGYGPSGAGYPTYLYGNEVYIGTGASRTTRMTVAADGAVSMTGSLSVAGRASAAGLDLPNNTPIQIYDNPGAGGTATLRGVLELTVGNNFVLGWSVGSAGYTTQLHGNSVNFYYGTAHTLGMSLTSAGKVNIASPSSADATVNVAGTIWASTGIWTAGFLSGGGISSSSDRRLKDGIKDFAYSSALLMALRPREWDWNDRTPMDGHSAGFVAQEVEQLLPYSVKERTYKTLTYDIFHALEVSGLQDHETRIRALENENKELKKRLEKYELGRN